MDQIIKSCKDSCLRCKQDNPRVMIRAVFFKGQNVYGKQGNCNYDKICIKELYF
jgi:hypothetical protein